MPEAYVALRTSVVAAGLLERAREYYLWRTTLSFTILLAGFALARILPLAAVVLIAFGSVQVALIGHDAGHLAVFASRRANYFLGSVCWTLAAGVSFAYWMRRHNRHHASTNDVVRDPDLQWDTPPALTPFLAFIFRAEGWRFALHELSGAERVAELVLLTLSAAVWLAPSAVLGPLWPIVVGVSQVLASVYLASVVAPNHIGMPMWQAGSRPDFMERQIRSSRNVRPSPCVDFIFGGLNYQIEHHLFPGMPRAHLSKARVLVKRFCAEHRIPYAESELIAIYRAILTELPHIKPAELG
jgi:fatty acid desaturase